MQVLFSVIVLKRSVTLKTAISLSDSNFQHPPNSLLKLSGGQLSVLVFLGLNICCSHHKGFPFFLLAIFFYWVL